MSIVLEQDSLDDVHHDLVGAFKDLVDAEVSEEPLNGVVLEVAIATVHLQAVIDNVEALVRGKLLSHRAVHRVVRISGFDKASTMSDHESRCFKVGCHLCKLELDVLIV